MTDHQPSRDVGSTPQNGKTFAIDDSANTALGRFLRDNEPEGAQAQQRFYEQLEAVVLEARGAGGNASRRCGWFGEGRGQCLLPEGHRAKEHTCEEDGRLLRSAREKGARLEVTARSPAPAASSVGGSALATDVVSFIRGNDARWQRWERFVDQRCGAEAVRDVYESRITELESALEQAPVRFAVSGDPSAPLGSCKERCAFYPSCMCGKSARAAMPVKD